MSSVKVAVRVKPSAKEVGAGISISGQSVTVHADNAPKTFNVDFTYASSQGSRGSEEQKQIFDDLGAGAVQAAWQGYNTCTVAYGQTGAGKTYTMMGYGDEPGMIPRLTEGNASFLAESGDARAICSTDHWFSLKSYALIDDVALDALLSPRRSCKPKYTAAIIAYGSN
jgi:hypothetical protein